MLRSRRGTLDSIPCSPHGTDTDFERRGSDQSSTSMVLPYRSSTKATWTLPTALSPAPAPASPKLKPERTHVRLRSDSALSMHTSKSSFRHYPDSRSESPMNSPWYWKKGNDIDAASTIDTISLGGTTSVASSDHAHYAGSIPSLFDRAVIKMVLLDPEVGSKLRAFADARGYSVDVDLLVKADQYTGAIDILRGLTEHVSTYLEVPATSTMDTPYTYPLAFKTNTKQCARNALPSLERLYREAKFAAEERLVNDLYPEFVKSQLADRLKASLSVTQSSSTNSFKPTYPGLGSAFCLTDSWKPDNPLVFASEGFMSMYGYERHEVFNNNCRFMQGHLTSGDAVRQIRNAVFTGQEHTELVVNYHKDGTPFWNFLFICPLVEDGIVRYCLGGQVDISKGMGTGHRDILDLLNFETSEVKSVPRTPEEIPECSAQQPIIHIEEPHLTDEKTAAIPRRSHRQRLFDRFLPKKHVPDNSHGESRPKYSTMSMNSRMSPSPTPMDGYVKEWGISNPFHDRHQVEPELLRPPPSTPTPYSCFFVMRYVPSPSTSFHIFPHQTNDKRHSRLPHLPVAFCSAEALDFLGLKGHDPSIVHSRSIFSLLVCATSSTDLVEKTFRSSVLESMAAGESISLEISTLDGPISSTTSTTPSPSPSPTPSSKLSLFSHTRARSRSNVGLGGRDSPTACGRDGALSAAGSEYHRPSTSRLFSDKLKEHGAEKFGNIFRLAGHEKTQGAGGQKQQLKGRKLSSHWTALKDAEGKVAWVVMILTSVAVA
ncbi:hypothetical protein B0T20DRAFT_353400 [Sordaria brevicollis]|uniref:PAS domain-containing protein n=1 Tax=Sordaria brevicollis TaxID=83679 RepID=A0AAE0PEA5_SORBR|nr:hypothetical protein B0T20DRAFT_353400 [Sordaria brevicollis]